MKQEIQRFSIRSFYDGYKETADDVVAFGGLLNVRPKFQREFIYPPDKQEAVIQSILKDCIIGFFTWSLNNDGTYSNIDGQQRSISILRFISGRYSINYEGKPNFFFNLPAEVQKRILDYELYVVLIEGTDEEKLDWFRIINIAGMVLTDQELRNATYSGPWLESAKLYFSKPNCPAYNIGSKYLNGAVNRQDYLEKALEWISDKKPEDYMAKHQLETNADELWDYFKKVIDWIKTIFPVYRKELKGLDWGKLYKTYSCNTYDPDVLEEKIKTLMMDDDVTKKAGIYEYVLSSGINEKVLNIRSFTDSQKRAAYEKQSGICPKCGKHFGIEEMEGDHIIPWSLGGKTEVENLQMLCKDCNRVKSNK